MTFGEAVNSYFKNAFNFNDRAVRSEYWYPMLFNFIVGFLLGVLGAFIPPLKILSAIYTIIVLIPSMAVQARRLHDNGISGWWLVLMILPIPLVFLHAMCFGVYLWAYASVAMFCAALIPSDPCDNQYGAGLVPYDAEKETVTSAKLQKYERACVSNSLIYVIGSPVFLVLINLMIYFFYMRGPYSLFETAGKIWIFSIVQSVFFLVSTAVILFDRTRKGILSLVVAVLMMLERLGYLLWILISGKRQILGFEKWTDAATAILGWVAPICLIILCVEFTRGKLKDDKLLLLLCFASLIVGLITALVYQIGYGDGYVDISPSGMVSLLAEGWIVFYYVALLFKFKLAILKNAGEANGN